MDAIVTRVDNPVPQVEEKSGRIRFATVWLAGCSGCHMSFLDLDEFLIDLAEMVDIVFSPVADIKEFPENVDVVLVEGAVANDDNLEMLLQARERSKMLIAFGDCAVTGNVTALRNPLGTALSVVQSIYVDDIEIGGQVPAEKGIVPVLLDRVRPLHEVVQVDAYLHGCPPSAARIREYLEALLAGTASGFNQSALKFG